MKNSCREWTKLRKQKNKENQGSYTMVTNLLCHSLSTKNTNTSTTHLKEFIRVKNVIWISPYFQSSTNATTTSHYLKYSMQFQPILRTSNQYSSMLWNCCLSLFTFNEKRNSLISGTCAMNQLQARLNATSQERINLLS